MDDPGVANDEEAETFYIEYGSTTERGVFNAGGGGYPCLEEAVLRVETMPGIGSTVVWKSEA